MDIESIFKTKRLEIDKLIKYGFIKENDNYVYTQKFMDDAFTAKVIYENNKVNVRVIDNETNDDYMQVFIESASGNYVGKVREELSSILNDIRANCGSNNIYIYNQANRVVDYIKKKYKSTPEFLWSRYPKYAVFRNTRDKWFTIIMDVDKSKITEDTGYIEIMNLKLDKDFINKTLNGKNYYKGYHMNAKNWFTIILDDSIDDKTLFTLIDASYDSVSETSTWIVPANPKYFDVISYFENNDTVEWKQTTKIYPGDTIYIYIAAPYSSIMYKCKAVQIDISYTYEDDNVNINKAMCLKLENRYEKDKISFKMLQEIGIKSIRGPRKMNKVQIASIDKI